MSCSPKLIEALSTSGAFALNSVAVCPVWWAQTTGDEPVALRIVPMGIAVALVGVMVMLASFQGRAQEGLQLNATSGWDATASGVAIAAAMTGTDHAAARMIVRREIFSTDLNLAIRSVAHARLGGNDTRNAHFERGFARFSTSIVLQSGWFRTEPVIAERLRCAPRVDERAREAADQGAANGRRRIETRHP